MTAIWYAVIAIGVVAGLAAGIWLSVVAFRVSVGWGLACVFIPFAALVFAVKFWEEAKLPFIVLLAAGGLVMAGTLGYSMSAVNAGLNDFSDFDDGYAWTPHAEEPTDEGPEASQPEIPISADLETEGEFPAEEPVDPAPSAEETAAEDEGMTFADPLPMEPPPEGRGRPRDVTVPLENLHLMVGEKVELILHSGQRISARVESMKADKVIMRHRVGGGSVAYPVPLAEISEIRIRRAP